MDAPLSSLPHGRRMAIMGAIMLGLFLSAMDQTVVGTALPRIIAEFSGLKLYSWVFTAYVLASTTLVPIVGKLGDIYGRKDFILIGIVIFLAGSVLCGASTSMVQLIIFRGVQGAGGGFLFANAFALVADMFTPIERGRYTGLMSGVFGLASVIGPLVGGAITDHTNWRWVFYVNLPLGVVALVVIALVLPPPPRREGSRKRVDYLGAAVLAGAIAPMLLGFSWAGADYAWASPQVITALAISAALLALLPIVELRAEDPIIPLPIFRNRVFAICTAATFVSGAAMFSGTVYIPLFMQGVLDFSATNAGLVLTPMTLAMVAGSATSGQIVSGTGRYKWTCVGGFVIATTGMVLLARLGPDSSQLYGMSAMALVGLGLGLTFPTLVLASQNALPHAMTGVTTSLNQFSRTVGGVIGVALMGSLLSRRLDSELASGIPPEVRAQAPPQMLQALQNPRILLDDGALARLRDEGFASVFGDAAPRLFDATVRSMKEGLAASISDVFILAAACMAAALLISVFLPERPLRTSHEPASAPDHAGEQRATASLPDISGAER